MKDASNPWTPDPQLLAAYFDGELECRDDLVEERARLEAWLEEHPEAFGEHRDLQKLWLATAPKEPSAAVWNRTLDQIDARRRQPIGSSANKGSWMTVGIMAASIAIFFGLLFGALRTLMPTGVKNDQAAVTPKEKANPANDEVEVFPVASAEEIVVFRIEGADTNLLVVGQLPVSGPLELAAPGDVRVFHAHPAEGDNMVPTVRQTGSRPPMIWAKLDTE